jgi:hypothetical protein
MGRTGVRWRDPRQGHLPQRSHRRGARALRFLRGGAVDLIFFLLLLEGRDLVVAELPELFQLKCLSPALEARPHLNGNNPSIPRI